MTYRIEEHNLDGTGWRRTHVYDVPPAPEKNYKGELTGRNDYWRAVTDVPCPACKMGTIRWAEAGYVPGYRICDGCGRHFLARGTKDAPTLLRVGDRRGGFSMQTLRKGVRDGQS